MRRFVFTLFPLSISLFGIAQSKHVTYASKNQEKIEKELAILSKYGIDISNSFQECINCKEYDSLKKRGQSIELKLRTGRGHTATTTYIIDGIPVWNIGEDANSIPLGTFAPESTAVPAAWNISRSDIDALPYTNIKDIAASSPAVLQQKRGGELNIRGGGKDGTQYIVDGMVIMR